MSVSVCGVSVCQWVTAWVEGPEHSYSICSFNNADGTDRRLRRSRERERERQKESKRQDAMEETEEETEI